MQKNFKKELFIKLITETLSREGGYVNNPKDPGGETKYGISKRSYPNLDIRNLTLDMAKNIYFVDFWIRYNCYKITNELLAFKLFDTSTNIGGRQAIRLLQKALVQLGSKISIDGVIGDMTLQALKQKKPTEVLYNYKQLIREFYIKLVDRNPKLKIFLAGWINRANMDLVC